MRNFQERIPLVLGSSSPYRKALLQRLNIPFSCQTPNIDESPLQDETPAATSLRLSIEKARVIATRLQQSSADPHLIIGSDQVALCEGEAINKPVTHAKAVEQLRFLSGKTVIFYSSLCLWDMRTNSHQTQTVPTSVTFRQLTNEWIEQYLKIEQPYDCAGSAKSEGLGVVLMQSVQTNDLTALMGLPLIALTNMLLHINYPVLYQTANRND